ncbi:EAL domain-containing protein [Pseudovibrio sp. Tun.PSC04-5.I4]|uniref:putative bifunctional diguanylate cyclase/phosphodiesterase n=1 Tax=Pseudovibrio sp. Tun.PSC04-5.I4 TaxID=1798213 RepID=UPI000B8708DF|nr:EAL domain-containing protein [Pseudovibrio sp. Tun.PSC04-5.I4]
MSAFFNAAFAASSAAPASTLLHETINQSQLLSQQQTLWSFLSTGLFCLGILGVLVVYSSLFIQERGRASHFLNRAFLLVFTTSSAYLLFGTQLHFEPILAGLLSWSTEIKLSSETTGYSVAHHAVVAAMVAVLTYLPLSHRLCKRATILLAGTIGGIIYPIFQNSAQGLETLLTYQDTAILVGFAEFGGGTAVTLLATVLAFVGILISGIKNTPALPEYILRNTQSYNILQIKAGVALMAIGGVGFSVGTTSVYSGELNNAIFNILIAITISILLGVFLTFLSSRRIMYPTILLSMIGGLSAVLGNAQHLTVEGTVVLTLTSATLSVVVARFIYNSSKTHSVIILYSSLGIGSIIGILGFTSALPAGHILSNYNAEHLVLRLSGASLTIIWAAMTGYIVFAIIKYTGLFRTINLNLPQTVNTTNQLENLISKLVWHDAKLDERLPLRDDDPQERLASLFNSFLDKLQHDEKRRKINSTSNKQQQELNKLATFAEGAFEGLAISTDGIIVECNHVLYELLGYAAEEMRGTSLLSHVASDYRELARINIASNAPTPGEIILVSKSGERIPIEVRGRLMDVAEEKLRVSAVRDMRKQKEDEARILHLAQHDMLTGLPNRTFFRERFQNAIETQLSSDNKLTAVMLLDLDRFKDINDLYGHPVGDKLIQTVGRRLNACVTHHDTVARLGGDEFAIIQVGLKTTAEIGLLTNKILEVLAKPIHVGNNITVRTSASIGIALIPDHGSGPDELMSKADIALYEAKEAGRNTFCFFEERMEEAILLRRTMEADLRSALENEELQLYFQPQARSDTRSIVGFEALLRWNHPTKGQIGPDDFIPVAEESGLSPARLELEVTETVLIHDDRRALNTLRHLKELGITIALDDFGTGYSSLSYLRRFPFDRLKIDRSFVSGVTKTPELAAIIRAVIDLGQALGMEVIAEGVETEPELELLRNESCDEVQGFLIGRPAEMDGEMAMQVSKANLEIQALDQYIAALQMAARKLKESEEQAASKDKNLVDAGD